LHIFVYWFIFYLRQYSILRCSLLLVRSLTSVFSIIKDIAIFLITLLLLKKIFSLYYLYNIIIAITRSVWISLQCTLHTSQHASINHHNILQYLLLINLVKLSSLSVHPLAQPYSNLTPFSGPWTFSKSFIKS
jgi:hypothetical protein